MVKSDRPFYVPERIGDVVCAALKLDVEPPSPSSSEVRGYVAFKVDVGGAVEAFVRRELVRDVGDEASEEWLRRFGPWLDSNSELEEKDFVQVAWGKVWVCSGVKNYMTSIVEPPPRSVNAFEVVSPNRSSERRSVFYFFLQLVPMTVPVSVGVARCRRFASRHYACNVATARQYTALVLCSVTNLNKFSSQLCSSHLGGVESMDIAVINYVFASLQ
jgi:hypothetical protein